MAVACRLCHSTAGEKFLDLGTVPLANALLAPGAAAEEARFPLGLWFCESCFLVQLTDVVVPEKLFANYVYVSSISQQWLKKCEQYASRIRTRLGLDDRSQVVEIGSNDGCLLRFFQRDNIPVLGVEPATDIAREAIENGVPTETVFFGAKTAGRLSETHAADLIVANNVFAHAPDLHDFVQGLAILLKPGGTITVEVPHLQRMLEELQFDTIYHEHVYYFSLHSIEAALSRYGLAVYDAEAIPSHGGSLRIYAAHQSARFDASPNIEAIRRAELEAGLAHLETYRRFAAAVHITIGKLRRFFSQAAVERKRIVGYSAAAKGVTLLNCVDPGPAALDYVVDLSPRKQGLRLPGTHSMIYSPERVFATKPDYLLLLAWNLREEIMEQMKDVRSWGCKFVVPVPEPTILA
jgi:SAM-dependent methyltransferase